MGQVTWSIQARKDLDEIVDHIANDSPSRAEEFHWSAFERTIVLEEHPLSGHPVPEILDPRIRELQHGNYRIIYWLRGERSAIVITIRHGKRKLTRAFLGRRRRNA